MRGNVPVFVARSDSRHIRFKGMDDTTLSVFVDGGGRGPLRTNDTVKRYSRGGCVTVDPSVRRPRRPVACRLKNPIPTTAAFFGTIQIDKGLRP